VSVLREATEKAAESTTVLLQLGAAMSGVACVVLVSASEEGCSGLEKGNRKGHRDQLPCAERLENQECSHWRGDGWGVTTTFL